LIGHLRWPKALADFAVFRLVFCSDSCVLTRHVAQVWFRASVKFQTAGYLQEDFREVFLRGFETLFRIEGLEIFRRIICENERLAPEHYADSEHNHCLHGGEFGLTNSICSHFGSKLSCWKNASMTRTVHSALARILCEHVRALREAAHMTQRDLAAALGREHGMVARIELGERRVDLVEAYQLFGALGVDPELEVASLMRKFEKTAKQLRKEK
jgi:hypothetical protein